MYIIYIFIEMRYVLKSLGFHKFMLFICIDLKETQGFYASFHVC